MSDTTTTESVQAIVTVDAGFICSACLAQHDMTALVTHDDDIYCRDCYDKCYYECSDCGDVDRLPAYQTVDYDDYCQNCYGERFTACDQCNDTCEGCEEVCSNDVHAENGYCEDCWRDRGLGKIQHLADRLDDPLIRAIRVSRDDSLDAGNCGSGTDEFIDEHFPYLYDWACVTIGQIVDAVCPEGIESLASSDMKYAKQVGLACLHAVRRSGRNF